MKTLSGFAPALLFAGAAAFAGCSKKTSDDSEPSAGAETEAAGETAGATGDGEGEGDFHAPSHENPAFVNIPNACYKEGALAGGQPSLEQLEEAAEKGYKTIINFQAPGEEGVEEEMAKAEELGMSYISIPIEDGDDLTEENAEAFAKALESAEPDVIVHCASGNRVGAMFAIKAHFVDGLSPEEAEQIGYESGMTEMAEDVRAALGL